MKYVEEWARHVKKNPTKWKKIHTQFINAIFDKQKQFHDRMLKQPGGKEKLARIYNIKNREGYDWLK
jgi:hypothetical protein